MGGLVFAQDADGNWGYKIGGADPVIPFRSAAEIVSTKTFSNNSLTISCKSGEYILALVLRAYGKDAWNRAGVSIAGCTYTELYNYRADQGGYQGDTSNLIRFIAYKVSVSSGSFKITATGDLDWGDAFKQISYQLIR